MVIKENLKNFGKNLRNLRIKKGRTLRKASRIANYDPSNWSKIERGIISPPSNRKTLKRWAEILGIKKEEIQKFTDEAIISQGIIPKDILAQKGAVKYLPAFFRTLRNKKPTKKDIDQLIRLIRNT